MLDLDYYPEWCPLFRLLCPYCEFTVLHPFGSIDHNLWKSPHFGNVNGQWMVNSFFSNYQQRYLDSAHCFQSGFNKDLSPTFILDFHQIVP